MNRARRILLLMVTTILLPACQGLKVGNIDFDALYKAGQRVGDLGDKSGQEEQIIGQNISSVLLKDRAILDDPPLQRYINLVGQWIAIHSERPNLPWRFVVLDDDSFNAYAAPGGYIYITKGTLMELDSEAELAGVLAHEIAHVIKKHHLNALKKEARVSIAKDLATFVYQTRQDQDGANTNSYVQHELSKEVLATAENIYYRGLDKEDEMESDAMAVVLVSRAGYDPFAFFSVLQKVEQQTEASSQWASFFERHPPPEDRIMAIDKILTQPFAEFTHFKTLQQRYLSQVD